MNRTDVLTGRIVQRILDGMNENPNKVTVVHGIDETHNLSELMRNLWLNFPDASITFRQLKYGNELKIEI